MATVNAQIMAAHLQQQAKEAALHHHLQVASNQNNASTPSNIPIPANPFVPSSSPVSLKGEGAKTTPPNTTTKVAMQAENLSNIGEGAKMKLPPNATHAHLPSPGFKVSPTLIESLRQFPVATNIASVPGNIAYAAPSVTPASNFPAHGEGVEMKLPQNAQHVHVPPSGHVAPFPVPSPELLASLAQFTPKPENSYTLTPSMAPTSNLPAHGEGVEMKLPKNAQHVHLPPSGHVAAFSQPSIALVPEKIVPAFPEAAAPPVVPASTPFVNFGAPKVAVVPESTSSSSIEIENAPIHSKKKHAKTPKNPNVEHQSTRINDASIPTFTKNQEIPKTSEPLKNVKVEHSQAPKIAYVPGTSGQRENPQERIVRPMDVKSGGSTSFLAKFFAVTITISLLAVLIFAFLV